MTNLPSPQPKLTPYLSIIQSRRPVQKTHTNIGHAKNAVNGKWGYRGAHEDMQVFEFTDGGWELLYNIKKGDLEPPWRAGEIAEAGRKKLAAEQREEERVSAQVTKQALIYLKTAEIYRATPFDSVDRKLLADAYVKGYMARKSENG